MHLILQLILNLLFLLDKFHNYRNNIAFLIYNQFNLESYFYFLYYILLYIYKTIMVHMNTKLKIIYIFKIYAIYIMVTDYVSKLCDHIKSFDKDFIKYSFDHPAQKYTL
jgi:hypothetical protein